MFNNFKQSDTKILITSLVAVALFSTPSFTYAEECEPRYGGGQDCTYNKSFDIEKKVRIKGSDNDEWKDSVTVKKGQTVEFKIVAKNTGEVEKDDMRMKDTLPDVMKRTGGHDLTEEFDNFGPKDKRTFIIEAQVKDSAFDDFRGKNCVVNTARLFYKSHEEASDTATVCYKLGEVLELPKTGSGEEVLSVALLGLGMLVVGLGIKTYRA